MIKKSSLYTFLLVILLTYVNQPFYFAGITALHKLAYYGLSLLPFALAVCHGLKKDNNTSFFTFYFFFYFIVAFLITLITLSFDFQYIIYLVRLLVGISATLSVYFIYKYWAKYKKITITFEKIYLKSVTFYIWGTIFFIAIPPLKEFWSSILADLGKTDFSDFVEYVTRFGFAGFSGFGCTFMVCTACTYLSYLYLNKEISTFKCKLYSILFIIGSFFYGRVGLVVTIITLGLTSLYCLFHKKPGLFKFYIFLVFLLIGIIVFVYLTIPDTQAFIEWCFEPIFNFMDKGKLESASTNGLKSFYKNFHPSDETLLHGDGYWLDLSGNGYYGHTDVGFMRNIYYGGVFYSVILYMLGLFFLFVLYQSMKLNQKKAAGFICFLMFIQLVIFEVKGDILFLFLKAYLPLLLCNIEIKQKSNSLLKGTV